MASDSHFYSILLPVYNEQSNLPLIVYLLEKYIGHLDYEIIIVEDNSPDQTGQIAERLREVYGDSKIKIHYRPGKMGLASAYTEGAQFASGDRIIIMDADLSHHPKFIPSMIELMDSKGFDIVSGTRYSNGGGVHGWNLKRVLTSRVANFLASTLLNPKMSDLTGSFRLYNADCLKQIFAQGIVAGGYVVQMEIICRARALKFSIGEVGITFVDRILGESKFGANEIFGYLKGLLQLSCVL